MSLFFNRLHLDRTASWYSLSYSTINKTVILHTDNHAFSMKCPSRKKRLKTNKNPYYVIDRIAWQLTVPHTVGYFQNRRLLTYSLLLNNDIHSSSAMRLHVAFYYARQQRYYSTVE